MWDIFYLFVLRMANEQQFVQLLKTHQNIVHKVCRIYMDTEENREDLFQEITLQAWKAYNSFKGDAKFSTWLYRVALNTALTFFKKDKKQQSHIVSVAIMPDNSEETLNPIEEKVQSMYKAIADLGKIDKALVTLYLEDYSYNEIGEMLDITPNNVAVKMIRIKQKLKETSQKYFQQ